MSLPRRTSSRSKLVEGSENEFASPVDPMPFPTTRTPLNSITELFQNPSEGILNESGPVKSEYPLPPLKGGGSTPRSAQIAPTRIISSAGNGGRTSMYTASRERGNSSRLFRGAPDVKSWPLVEASHFELEEDPSFWMDHNVQVLIRIRPVSSAENASQGHGRCLRQESSQTLTWTGHPETRFTFDHIASETISQEKLFKVAGVPMVENCMSGYNSCMFAYGQTGSGKTYTMLGEILEMNNSLSEHRGMTPRIFEHLFMRIREEEEKWRDELKYTCKCSFLEIYNEQITDLLDPSSNNLQLREDMKQGVYVENLSEHEVTTVKEVVQLLSQGAANRKMAATNMNSESSRSHSVFTCIIESRREKDSMTHLRFGRLNLVDLAGSERQKSSGAEGERLKEAANINRSLSTLGLVIMTLVDVANGKHRHVSYRDSRLTFLLQDSLGGNSKTTIIANVSPSICSANETLSTLKFAQRAKLIQNNAKVNEDASGDVMALQLQIQKLKDQLTFLINQQNVPWPLSCHSPCFEPANIDRFDDNNDSSLEGGITYSLSNPSILNPKMKYLEATLVGAMRREKMAEGAVRRLEAEVEHMNRLVCQRDDDAQRAKMMLRLRDERIRRLELLADGLVSADGYLMEENNALSEEIQLLRTRIDRNPELTRFALENVRLLEQLRISQDFCHQGERDILLAEVSELRDQLLKVLEGKLGQVKSPFRRAVQDDIKADKVEAFCRRPSIHTHVKVNSVTVYELVDDAIEELGLCKKELAACLETNVRLTREVEDLHCQMRHHLKSRKTMESTARNPLYRSIHTDRHSSVELTFAHNSLENDVESVGSVEHLIECEGMRDSTLHEKLEKLHRNLEEARILNNDLCSNHGSQLSCQHEMKQVQEQVETAKTFCYLQEELFVLQKEVYSRDAAHSSVATDSECLRMENQELQEKLCFVTQENVRLSDLISARDAEITSLAEDWEKTIIDLTTFLVDGCHSIEEASDHVGSILDLLPGKNIRVSVNVERAMKAFLEREKLIINLQQGLEDAQKMGLEMKLKLNSLKGATLAMHEIQHLENTESAKDLIHLRDLLNEKMSEIQELENNLKCKDNQIIEAERWANAAFIVSQGFSKMNAAECLGAEETKNVADNLQSKISIQVWDCMPTNARLPILSNDSYCKEEETVVPQVKALLAIEHVRVGNQEIKAERNLELEMATQRTLDANNVLQLDNVSKQPYDCPSSLEMFQMLQTIEKRMEEADAGCFKTREMLCLELNGSKAVAEDKTKQVASWIQKFEEAQEIMNEADLMLNALLKVNENAKHEIDRWKRASEELLTERTALASEVKQLRASTFLKDEQYRFFEGQIDASLSEILNSMSLLEGSLQQVQETTVEELKTIYSDISSFGRELMEFITTSRSWFETILSMIMGKDFALFVLFQCQMGALIDNTVKLILDSDFVSQEPESMSVPRNLCELSMLVGNSVLFKRVDKVEKIHERLKSKIYGLGGTLETQNVFRQAPVGPLVDTNTLNWERKDSSPNCSLVEVNKLEKENSDLAHDMKLITEALAKQVLYLEEFIKELSCESEASKCAVFPISKENSEVGPALEQTSDVDVSESSSDSSSAAYIVPLCQPHISQDNITRLVSQKDDVIENEVGCITTDLEILLAGMQHLRTQCTQLIALKDDHSELSFLYDNDMHQRSIKLNNTKPLFTVVILDHLEAKTEYGNQSIQALNEFWSNLSRVLCVKTENKLYGSFLEAFSLGIYRLEKKISEFLARSSRHTMGQNDAVTDILSLKRELTRKDDLLKGIFFDFRLLQESKSCAKDMKDESEQIVIALNQVQNELAIKTAQIDRLLVHHRDLETRLNDTESALSISRSEHEQAKETMAILLKENTELRLLLDVAYVKKTDAENQLEDKGKLVEGLENEVLCMKSSLEENIFSSVEEIVDELRRVSYERNHLHAEVASLNDKLEMMSALADENEALAVEARQDSEAAKIYAEQKEEEVKVLECCVEELEGTINVLEKKVCEMGEEVQNYRSMGEELEQELQALKWRMLTVENASENLEMQESNSGGKHHLPRCIDDILAELQKSRKCIKNLERERAKQAGQVKLYEEHITELVLHSEAQSSLYEQKFKMLESMVYDVKDEPSTNHAAKAVNKTEKSSVRTRHAGSPFKCISSLVQQMNLENDHELSAARLKIEELEGLAADRQKQVCMLTARLATVDSMTHDVIRDLLGVKLDMTNYANLIDQEQLEKLIEEAQHQTKVTHTKEEDILNLKKQVTGFIEERESWINKTSQMKTDILANQVMVERLQQRDQLLRAQNEMLKLDKANLTRKIAELDEMVKKLVGSQSIQEMIHQRAKNKENGISGSSSDGLTKRLTQSDKLVFSLRK